MSLKDHMECNPPDKWPDLTHISQSWPLWGNPVHDFTLCFLIYRKYEAIEKEIISKSYSYRALCRPFSTEQHIQQSSLWLPPNRTVKVKLVSYFIAFWNHLMKNQSKDSKPNQTGQEGFTCSAKNSPSMKSVICTSWDRSATCSTKRYCQ